MELLVDECTGPAVARWLRGQGHEVFSVYEQARGMEDADFIEKARAEGWVLVTNDKDFGEKVYKERHAHRGVVLLRLDDETPKTKIQVLQRLLVSHGHSVPGAYVVVSETQVHVPRATD